MASSSRSRATGTDTTHISIFPDLTFGIELEYVLLRRKRSSDSREADPDLLDADAVQIVFNSLAQKLPARCMVCNSRVWFDLPLNRDPLLTNTYECWNVDNEYFRAWSGDEAAQEALGIEAAGEYEYRGVEIISRILHAHKHLEILEPTSTHVHRISYDEEIKAVLRKLKHDFCMLSANRSKNNYLYNGKVAAYHVHIGNYRTGFDLETVKNVLCVSLACERLLDGVHPTHRIDGVEFGTREMSTSNQWATTTPGACMGSGVVNVPLSYTLLLEKYRRDQRELCQRRGVEYVELGPKYPVEYLRDDTIKAASKRSDIDAWMTLVNKAPDLTRLLDLYPSYPKNTVVNILPLHSQNADPVKKTIEFRQHMATFDVSRIVSWIELTCRLVEFCKRNNAAVIAAHLKPEATLRAPDANVLTLARLIGCNAKTVEHYASLLSGEYAKNARAEEKRLALIAQAAGDPIARLALYSVKRERSDTNRENARRRIMEKLLAGGYGQFPRSFIDSVVPPNVSEADRRKITLGYKAPLSEREPEWKQFRSYDSTPEGSEGYRSSDSAFSTPYVSEEDEPKSRVPTLQGTYGELYDHLSSFQADASTGRSHDRMRYGSPPSAQMISHAYSTSSGGSSRGRSAAGSPEFIP
jgi:hypothetical protein